jgi:hypothetical protein
LDEHYQDYVNRVAPMILGTTHCQQVQHIQKSAKFEDGKAIPFPGYTLTTPPWEDDSPNELVYQSLQQIQEQLLTKLGQNLFIPISPSSFHVTLADLIWENNFRNTQANNPQFEEQICDRINHSFKQYQQDYPIAQPIHFQLLGLTLFTRGIVICLAPANEKGYEQIRHLRRMIYQNQKLIELGIDQQYDFTAHITLGYFNDITEDLDRQKIVEVLEHINDQLLENPLKELICEEAQLRQFDNMLRYYRQDHFPILTL